MPHRRCRWAVVCLLVACGIVVGTAEQLTRVPTAPARDGGEAPKSGSGTIKGKVIDAETGQGIARATLALFGGGSPERVSATAGDDGGFTFAGLLPGTYVINASKPGYLAGRVPEFRVGFAPSLLVVEDGSTTDGVIVRLSRASAITGRVVDASGDPVPQARVSLRRAPGTARGPHSGMFIQHANTNDIGEFRLAPVAPGSYLVMAATDVEVPPTSAPRRSGEGGFVIYPGAQTLEEAQPLVVTLGQDLSGIELRLLPSRPVSVSGTVIGLDGTPARGAIVSVGEIMPGDEEPMGGSGMNVKADGTFAFSLRRGVYDLSAELYETGTNGAPRGPQRSLAPAAVERVTVADAPIEGVRLQLRPPVRVTGRIVFDGSTEQFTPPPEVVTLWAASGAGRCRYSPARVNADLTFSIEVRGVRCQVGADVRWVGWQLQSVTQGEKDVTFEGLAVDGGEPAKDVVITFDDRPTRLLVDVADARGLPADAFVVFVFPIERARRATSTTGHPGLKYRTTRRVGPSRTGRARIEGLFPGDYYVVAVEPQVSDALSMDDVAEYDRFEPGATRVSLADGESKALSLKVQALK